LERLEAAPDLLTAARERFATRDYRGAALLLDSAIRSGQGYADAHHLLGMCYALTEQPEQALHCFDAAVRLNPRYVEAHLNRAIILGDLGRGAEAKQGMEQALSLGAPDASGFPSMVGDRLANMHADLGRAYREAGAFSRAVEHLQTALDLRPSFADLRLDLARARLEAGDPASAGAELDAVLEKHPDWLDAMLLRGLAAYLSGNLEQAKAVWDRASERNPDEPRLESYRSMLARRLREQS
jgi:tetratricopeptide (TPR) repeat protein